ncbi:MAG TPA: hypothetical protein PLI23_13155 [Thermoclostridium caenicola]|uniref:hypothetical protein n=1 Tax=Thermoclostridium caenicola TaxID=659425 RepID=UPI002C7347C3|nr:hypothetical protein [Thermoclostridium caenicola]HPO78104.1 hypothetical protein [Thermoclostridium caenicola]
MLFRKQSGRIRRIQNMHPIIFLPLLIAIIIAISACSAPKGSIVILENPNGTGFTMDFKKWSSKSKCELSLNKGDVLQIEVFREDGEIALMVSGNSGSEPYTGNNLKSGLFTVTVSETDKYDIQITGKDATGKVMVK